MLLYNTIVLKQASWVYFTIYVNVGGSSAKQTYFFMKQYGICKKKVLTATELSQTTKEVVDFGKALMRVIVQENVFLHRKLETEEILLKAKISRFLHLLGQIAVLKPLVE